MAIDKEKLMGYYRNIKEKADSYYEKRIEREWQMNLKMYEDTYQFDEYKPANQNVKLPLTDNLVTRMSSYFTRTLVDLNNDFFTIDSIPEEMEFAAKASEDIVGYTMEQNKVPKLFNKGFTMGLLTAPLYFKVEFEETTKSYYQKDENTGEYTEVPDLQGEVCVSQIDPRLMRLDPSADVDTFIQELADVPLHEFKELADANGWNPSEVEKVIHEKKGVPENEDAKTGQPAPDNYNPMVKLRTTYSQVAYDDMGEELGTNIKFIVAEDKFLMICEQNTLPDGEFPYVVGRPLVSVTGKYGRGYISKLRSLLSTYIEAVDLLMMQYRLNVWGLWTYDYTKVPHKGEHNLTKTIRAGQWYPMKGTDGIKNMYQNGSSIQIGMQIQDMLDFMVQTMSFQNEFIQGRASTHSRTTAYEIRQKTDQAQTFYHDIALQLEDEVLNPLIRKILLVTFDNWDEASFKAKDYMIREPNHLQSLENMSYIDRMRMLQMGQIKARGMSGKVRRAGMFDKIALLFEIGAQYPPLMQGIKNEKIVQTIFESVGESTADWYDPTGATVGQGHAPAGAPVPGGQPTPEQPLTEEQVGEIINQQGGI